MGTNKSLKSLKNHMKRHPQAPGLISVVRGTTRKPLASPVLLLKSIVFMVCQHEYMTMFPSI